MSRLGAVLLTVALAGTPVAAHAADRPANPVTIYVSADATVEVNGQVTTLNQVDPALAKAASAHQTVMYFRDNPNSDPSPEVEKTSDAVIGSVARHQLPICFATDATFAACGRMGQ